MPKRRGIRGGFGKRPDFFRIFFSLIPTVATWVPIWGTRSPWGPFSIFGSPLGPHFCSKVPIFTNYGLRTREKSMQPLSNVNHLITCDYNTSTYESHASLSVLVKNSFPPFKRLYFIELACLSQFRKHALFGSPFGPHFTENWVPIGSPF